MPCDRVQAQLTAYLDGELDGDRGTVIRGHLRTCAACRQVAADEAVLRDGLRALPPAEPPPSLWANVQAQLAAAEVAEAQRPAWRRALTRWSRWLPAPPRYAAVGLVGAAALVIAWKARTHEAASTTTAPELAVAPPPPAAVHVAPAPVAPPTPEVAPDVSADLEAEPARVTASYRQTVDELLEVAADMRSEWSDDRATAFDARVSALERAAAAADDGKPRQRALRTLIRYLQGALIRDDVVLASRGAR